MAARSEIRFLLNGADVTLDAAGAGDTLLDYLRLQKRLTGTKEGCAEGDCGACTVLVGRLTNGQLHYEVVNACIRFMASLDGCHVVTIEHLSGPNGRMHPVQQAMVEHHGSQCGFCTPGFVMSLYALWMETPNPTETQIETALQGNLCRCTGYEPIIRAAQSISAYGNPAQDALNKERAAVTAQLETMADGQRVELRRADSLAILPADVDDLADALSEYPDATMVAGATDVGLWVTKFLKTISPAIFLSHLDELRQIEQIDRTIRLGAGVSYSASAETLCTAFPHLREYWDRIAGWQIRNMGTIGGNIANGSPIGDTPPVLIALGAQVILRKGTTRRSLPLEAFFIDYGQQDLAPGEFVERIDIPLAQSGAMQAAYKISKRRDEDISAVAVGMNITVANGQITQARIAFGGMAATPKRAASVENALVGQPWSEATMLAAAAQLPKDFQPLSDWRASSAYRMRAAQNLLRRFWLEQTSDDTQTRLLRA